MITINFFTTLRTFLKTKQVRIRAEEIRILDLLKQCEAQTPIPFLHKLLDENGNINPETMILVNGQNVLHLQGINTIVRNGTDVALFLLNGER